ncbi:probable tRNA (uracil-O(2)-)-methyltransferase [Zophobas morio]|uniref:probable tRNA (uracil-O(2)-)-methyltransferase n=1 Tax=Zophobas morio TaxID=2755281 RepID=UPI003082BC1C
MDQIPLATSSTLLPLESFWNSVLVYHDKPHVVNRKLATVSPIFFCKIGFHCPRIKRLHEIFTWEALIYKIRKAQDFTKLTPDFIKAVTENYDKEATITNVTREDFHNSVDGQFISLRVLFPRQSPHKCLEVVIFDKEKRTATFFAVQEQDHPLVAPRFPYHIELTQSGNLRIVLNNFEDADTSAAEWLSDKLFPKVLKWAENGVLEDAGVGSLSLIASDEYYTLYSSLKEKYGEKLVRQWPTKAKTDPQKYIFEDIAIATYLICLWRKIGAQDINFVDCGCGNGLLVYILNREGYTGFGLDVRSRKVWELYSDQADLRIGIVKPDSTFPQATWVIGNHSDELTPWIPIIALNSSNRTNYFVLPCCPYDLNGCKYARVNIKLSQYGDYLDYVENLSNMCGFTTSIDKLRIPSTRRVCLVGVRDNFDDSQIGEIKKQISNLISDNLKEFKPRNAVEPVQNCSRLNRDLITRITNFVVKELLETLSPLRREFDGKSWNQGGTRNLNELCDKISPEDKQSLKNECGGLQTLLKNRKYIFNVRWGMVNLQKPLSLKESSKYKDKPCWFFKNHPDGCLHQSETCAYKHIDD